MSDYVITIKLYSSFSPNALNQFPADYSWTVYHGINTSDESDPVVVLDNLSVGWSFPDGELYPTQPDPDKATIRLLVDDASGIADMVGAWIKVVSNGVTLVNWTGRIVQPTAVPVRRKTTRKMLVTIPVRDLILDFADVAIDLVRPAESLTARLTAIQAAIAAAPDLPFYITGVDLPGTSSSVPILDALNAKNQSVYQLLNDTFRQDGIGGRFILRAMNLSINPSIQLGPFRIMPYRLDSPGEAMYPPGVLQLAAHRLGVAFDGATPAPAGLELQAGRIDEDSIAFTSLRSQSVNRIRLTGPFPKATFEATNGLKEGRTVVVSTTITNDDEAAGHLYALAALLMPDPLDSGFRWSLDGFKWRPTDPQIGALDFPLVPSNITLDTPYAYYMPAAITGLIAAMNPGSDDTFYGGQVSALTLTVTGGDIILTGKIARRLTTSPAFGNCVTWADIKANFPTVATKTGTDVLSPTMSSYDLKLARKM